MRPRRAEWRPCDRMRVLPVGGEQQPGPDRTEHGGHGAAVAKVGSRLRFGRPRFFRQGSPSAAFAAAVSAARARGSPAASARRWSGRGSPTDHPWPNSRTIVPPTPSSASSGWGATTKASSIGPVSAGPLRLAYRTAGRPARHHTPFKHAFPSGSFARILQRATGA